MCRSVGAWGRLAFSEEFKASWEILRAVFEVKSEVSTGLILIDSPVAALQEFLTQLCGEMPSLDEWGKFTRWRRDMPHTRLRHRPSRQARFIRAARTPARTIYRNSVLNSLNSLCQPVKPIQTSMTFPTVRFAHRPL